uniref:Uncharacterized protein n=1 Tax=Rhizophora mucronata TaxID=61149 RepID=A0A2P2Q1C8_RHIMU
MSVVEMRILRWIYDHSGNDQVRNKDICSKVDVVLLKDKLGSNVCIGLDISNQLRG